MIPRQQIRTYLNGKLLLYFPSPPLSYFVNHIWYARDCGNQRRSVERFLPNGSMDLILNLGDEPEKLLAPDGRAQDLICSWITGIQAREVCIETPSRLHMIGVEFKPGGAFPFFRFPMSELAGSSVELDLIWGEEANRLREAMFLSKTDEEKFSILQAFLVRRLRGFEVDPFLDRAITLIATSEPALRIRALADCLGMEQKRLIARFERVVGVSPKLFARICRFQKALGILHQNGFTNLTTVALSCDYFDQSHFIKEFEEFSGFTPTRYLLMKGVFPGWISE